MIIIEEEPLKENVFMTLALYATRIELKLNNQDETEAQTFSFNTLG